MAVRKCDAAFDLLHCFPDLAGARKRDTKGIVSLRSCNGCLSRLGIGDDVLLFLGLGERLLSPGDGACVVAGSESKATDFLKELSTFDRVAVVTELLEPIRKAGLRQLSVARFPVQASNLRWRRAAAALSG